MPDYDAVVIGAGHNGLTAAAVMARGGMRVLCLEKNHFIGGMATTTELARGYRFELAGSIQFPVPNEIFDDLGFFRLPHLRTRGAVGQHRAVRGAPRPAVQRPDQADGPPERRARAWTPSWAWPRWRGGRRPRPGPSAASTCASHPGRWTRCGPAPPTRRSARPSAPRMFGSVMDVVDQFLPDRQKHAQVRSMLAFLAVNSTYRGPYSPGSALCLAFALASPGDATMSKVRGGIGTMSEHLLALFERHGGELCRHAKVAGILTSGGRVEGVTLADGEVVTAPVVVSNLDPTATFTQLLDGPTLGAGLRATGRCHRPPGRLLPGALRPRRTAGVRPSLRGAQPRRPPPQRHLLRDGRADAARLRGVRAGDRAHLALVQPLGSQPAGSRSGSPRQARGQQFRLLCPDRRQPRRPDAPSETRWPNASWPRSPPGPPTSPT